MRHNSATPAQVPVLPSSQATILLCDTSFEADRTGALWWPGQRTLVVADLHLEKGSAYARRGSLLPPYDTTETLRRLSDMIDKRQPETIISLGDSFHDIGGMDRLSPDNREILRNLQRNRDWAWVTGNHDPKICDSLGGRVEDELTIAEITFRHGPGPSGTTGEIAGHLHPCARVVRHGRSIRRPCFASNGQRLIMPAFGAYTGGLSVCDAAFSSVFQQDDQAPSVTVWMMGRGSVYPIAGKDIKPD